MCVSEDDTVQMCVVVHGCTQLKFSLQPQKAAFLPDVYEKGIYA